MLPGRMKPHYKPCKPLPWYIWFRDGRMWQRAPGSFYKDEYVKNKDGFTWKMKNVLEVFYQAGPHQDHTA